MRKLYFDFCLVFAACGWFLAAHVSAGGGQAAPRLTGQWRIFPRAPFTRPADEEITARLTRQIDRLDALFRPNGSSIPRETLGDSLIDGKARNQFFRLEGILRLYARAFPDLDNYSREVKDLEDGLGAYSFAVDSLKFAKDKFKLENQTQAPTAARKAEQDKVLQGLEKKKDTAHVVFTKLVERSTLNSDLPEFKSLVMSSFTGWSSSKDREYVTHELLRVLGKVQHGRYNFNLLEDGIHEFRRRLRWFPVMVDSLDGLILVRDDAAGACPNPALEKLAGSPAAKHRYSNPELAFPATQPCTISRCLLWQVVKTTNDIGRLKDEAQGEAAVSAALDDFDEVASGNNVSPQEIARAQALRTELFSSRALDSLTAQLSSCKP